MFAEAEKRTRTMIRRAMRTEKQQNKLKIICSSCSILGLFFKLLFSHAVVTRLLDLNCSNKSQQLDNA